MGTGQDLYRTKDVDVVIATNELEVMLNEDAIVLATMAEGPLDR